MVEQEVSLQNDRKWAWFIKSGRGFEIFARASRALLYWNPSSRNPASATGYSDITCVNNDILLLLQQQICKVVYTIYIVNISSVSLRSAIENMLK